LKDRIAIWVQGGIGGGDFSQGQPPLPAFVEELSTLYSVTVYSIFPANPDFSPSGFEFVSINRHIRSLKIRSLLICIVFLWNHFKKPYSLLHAIWVYPAGAIIVVLGKLLGIPSVVTVQGGEAASVPSLNYGHMLNPYLKRITFWTCQKATAVTAISKFLVSKLQENGLVREDIHVIPWGPDIKMFKPNEEAKGELLHIIHVANLTEVKDQITLLKSFALIVKQIPSKLRIIGSGSMEEELKTLTEKLELSDHVEFLGAIPHKQLPQHYKWANLMIHCSLHEGQSVVVVEAMACGVVACGTRVGIISDLGDDYFETVDVGDYEALGSRVVELWSNKNKYSALQEKSYSWVRQYNFQWTVDQYASLYNDLMIGNK
jgi:glycosyltransferase involved in cell wall biosynthesis